jgi:hypothetical protein
MVRNIIPARNQCRDEPRNTADAIAVRSAATAAHSLARVPARTVGLPSGAASVIELTLCADQPGVFAYDHIDLRPIRPVTTRVHLHTGCCPRCKRRVAARPPVDMRPGSPFGSGIAALVTYGSVALAQRRLRQCPAFDRRERRTDQGGSALQTPQERQGRTVALPASVIASGKPRSF